MDVTQLDQVEGFADFAFEAFGEVALVVNNAGIGQPRGSIIDVPMEDIRQVMDVNFFGVWNGCKVFGKRLTDQGTPAAIYNTSSENAYFVAVSNSASYVASKHVVHGMTDAFREEVPEFINVGVITPGFVGSEMIPEGFRGMAMAPDEFAAIILPQIRAGEFYVVSHGYNQVRIDDRYQAISDAFTKYAPRQEGDEKYDVRVLLAQMSRN